MIPLYHALDLRGRLAECPEHWPRLIVEAAATHGRRVVKRGRGPGSLEPEETAGLDYTVLDGGGVKEHLPWLWALYHDLVPLVSETLDAPVHVSDDVASSINVNVLRGSGARYEAHVDAQPYSLLLFITNHPPGMGGRLLLGGGTSEIGIPPRAGYAVLFDGARTPHRVEPIVAREGETALRVSIPMTYLPKGVSAADRPAGLDDYLFESADA